MAEVGNWASKPSHKDGSAAQSGPNPTSYHLGQHLLHVINRLDRLTCGKPTLTFLITVNFALISST